MTVLCALLAVGCGSGSEEPASPEGPDEATESETDTAPGDGDPSTDSAPEAPTRGCSLGDVIDVASAEAAPRELRVARNRTGALVTWRVDDEKVWVRTFDAEGAPRGPAVEHDAVGPVAIAAVGERYAMMWHAPCTGSASRGQCRFLRTLDAAGAAVGDGASQASAAGTQPAFYSTTTELFIVDAGEEQTDLSRLRSDDDGTFVREAWEIGEAGSRFPAAETPAFASDGRRVVALLAAQEGAHGLAAWRSNGPPVMVERVDDDVGRDFDIELGGDGIWVSYGGTAAGATTSRRLVKIEYSGRSAGPWLLGNPGTHPRPSEARAQITNADGAPGLVWTALGGEALGAPIEVPAGAVGGGDERGAFLAFATPSGEGHAIRAHAARCDPHVDAGRQIPPGAMTRIGSTAITTGTVLGADWSGDDFYVLTAAGVETFAIEPRPRAPASRGARAVRVADGAALGSLSVMDDLAIFAAGEVGIARVRIDAPETHHFFSPGDATVQALLRHERALFVATDAGEGCTMMRFSLTGDAGESMDERSLEETAAVAFDGASVAGLAYVDGQLVAAVDGAPPHLRVFAVGDDGLELGARLEIPRAPRAVDAAGSNVVVITEGPGEGAHCVDLSDPAAPRLVRSFADASVVDVAMLGDDVYLAEPSGDLLQYGLDPGRGAIASGVLIAPAEWEAPEDPRVGPWPRVRAHDGLVIEVLDTLSVVRVRAAAP